MKADERVRNLKRVVFSECFFREIKDKAASSRERP
jgi:hypothetical protein